jgi:hypothetical protein
MQRVVGDAPDFILDRGDIAYRPNTVVRSDSKGELITIEQSSVLGEAGGTCITINDACEADGVIVVEQFDQAFVAILVGWSL